MLEGKRSGCLIAVLLLSVVAFTSQAISADDEIIVVQSADSLVHNSILNGIRSVVKAQSTTVSTKSVRQHLRPQPKAYIAIGEDALNAVKDLGVPVIFSMVVNPARLGIKGRNITGVEAFVSVDKQLANIREVFPTATRIGTLYTSAAMGHIMGTIRQTAARRGLTIVGGEAKSADEAIFIMDHMVNDIDVFLMLPDTTVVTPETVKHLFKLSVARKIPVFAFSEKYIKDGAVIAMGIDLTMLGQQLGQMANRVLAGEPAASIPIESVKNGDLFVNTAMAASLNLHVSHSFAAKAHHYLPCE